MSSASNPVSSAGLSQILGIVVMSLLLQVFGSFSSCISKSSASEQADETASNKPAEILTSFSFSSASYLKLIKQKE